MRPWRVAAMATVLVTAAGCTSQPAFQDPYTRPQISWQPSLVLEDPEAQRILGTPCRLDRTTAYLEEETKAYQSTFRDNGPDASTGRTGVLYYMYEEYKTSEAARAWLYSTLRENRLDPAAGIRTKEGSEIHYLAGGSIVRMVMILRENRLVRLKVNPVTSHYRLEELQRVAEELASRL